MEEYKKELKTIRDIQNKIEYNVCSYCGTSSECLDHAFPLTYFHTDRATARKMYHNSGWKTVHSCRSCNSLAGYVYSDSFAERKILIKEEFEKKYRKNLKARRWGDEEISELGYVLARTVSEKRDFDDFIKLRYENLCRDKMPVYGEKSRVYMSDIRK